MAKKDCPKCKGLGWISLGNSVVKCECVYSDLNNRLYIRMNIPKRYRDKSFKNFQTYNKEQRRLIEDLKDYVLSPNLTEGESLFLYGNPGVGKTHLAVAVLKEIFFQRKIVGLFYDTRTLLFDLKSTFDGSRSGREILDDVINAPVLVLDDLGSERMSDWARDILHYIIVRRYNDMLPMIITSNMRIEGEGDNVFEETLEERMGSAIASRIIEVCRKFEVKGDDFRKSDLIERLKIKGDGKNENSNGKKRNKRNTDRSKNKS